MRDNLTPQDIANSISLMRSAFKGTFLVVEGVTDERLYGKFIDDNEVTIIIAHSKDNVKRSVSECWGRRKDKKVVGITDADLDCLRGKKSEPPIFVTDRRDIETMMVGTRALDDVLVEYGEKNKVHEFEGKYGCVRDVILNSGAPLGIMMYISMGEGLGMNFKNLDFTRFISNRSLGNDKSRMITEVYDNSPSGRRINKEDMVAFIVDKLDSMEDPQNAARGHDVLDILLIGLRYIFGNYNCKGMGPGQLGGALRLSFGVDSFVETDLYKNSKSWASERELVLWEV